MQDPTTKNMTNMELFLLRSDLWKTVCFRSTYVCGGRGSRE